MNKSVRQAQLAGRSVLSVRLLLVTVAGMVSLGVFAAYAYKSAIRARLMGFSDVAGDLSRDHGLGGQITVDGSNGSASPLSASAAAFGSAQAGSKALRARQQSTDKESEALRMRQARLKASNRKADAARLAWTEVPPDSHRQQPHPKPSPPTNAQVVGVGKVVGDDKDKAILPPELSLQPPQQIDKKQQKSPPDEPTQVHIVGSASSSDAPSPPSPPLPPPLLVIGIPSVRREGDTDYVSKTVDYVLQQTKERMHAAQHGEGMRTEVWSSVISGSDIPGPHPLRVRVVVMCNTRAGGDAAAAAAAPRHQAFESMLAQQCGEDGKACTQTVVNQHTVYIRADSLLVLVRNGIPVPADGNDAGSPNVPGYRVRQQTRDVSDLLDLAHALYGHAEAEGGIQAADGQLSPSSSPSSPALRMSYYMAMEDDFRLCDAGLASVSYAAARATAEHGTWNAIRASYGLNGAVLRGHDVPVLARYYKSHVARRPPDHLMVEWFAGERPESAVMKGGRPHLAFRYNILEHFGFSSSLRPETSPVYAYCYDLMDGRVVFDVEAFKLEECLHDDIWPCLGAGDPRYRDGSLGRPAGINFDQLSQQARAKSVQTWSA